MITGGEASEATFTIADSVYGSTFFYSELPNDRRGPPQAQIIRYPGVVPHLPRPRDGTDPRDRARDVGSDESL